eukprot:1142564-Pelagomonas_calceolata.AAC.3
MDILWISCANEFTCRPGWLPSRPLAHLEDEWAFLHVVMNNVTKNASLQWNKKALLECCRAWAERGCLQGKSVQANFVSSRGPVLQVSFPALLAG